MLVFDLLTIAALLVGLFGQAPYQAPDGAEVAAVKARLRPLQLLSFATGREYCGYLIRHDDGSLGFTDMVRGGHNGCSPQIPLAEIGLIASVHTHGAYDSNVPAEFPTALDMTSDRRENVNGYIATPGGRLWYIDSRSMRAHQICGLGCLPQDRGFHAGDDGIIAESYSYRELVGLESPH